MNLLETIRKWWRPISCIGIAGSVFTHGIVVPLYELAKGIAPTTDLSGLSLLVTAVSAAFAVREWGKVNGSSNGS